MNPAPVLLREEIDVRLLSNLSFNFQSRHEALFELVDNALASRIAGEPVKVTMTGKGWSTPGGTLKVTSRGGQGMDLGGLRKFLQWGKRPDEPGLNRYGQGGKAAIGYLGTGVHIRANGTGEADGYEFKDSGWLDRPDGNEKEFLATPVPAAKPGEGTVEIEIFDLSKTINAKKLERELAWCYRPAIVQGDLVVRVKNTAIKPVPLNAGARHDFDHTLVVQTPENPEGESVRLRGWVGIAPEKAEGGGGMRCSAYGRVIVRNEYFGHRTSTFKASLSSLVGEVDLSFVPPTLNKTSFSKDSTQWQLAQEVVYREMAPFIEKLLQRKDPGEPSEEERLRAMEAKDIAHRALQKIAADSLRRGETGRQNGRRPPSPSDEPPDERVDVPPASTREPAEREPKTAPPDNAVGRLKRKGLALDWDVRSLDPKIRSATATDQKRPEIVINKNYPLYRERGGDLPYMLETGLMEELKPNGDDDKGVAEYHAEVVEVIYEAISSAGDGP